MPPDYFSNVRKLCNDIGCLLILDEVQTGMGGPKVLCLRALRNYSDIMTLAKGLPAEYLWGLSWPLIK
jgi:acetylornithine/succinyldiaminopimelate/putrescine aminotransferase